MGVGVVREASRSSRACGVSSGMIITAVGAVRGGGGAAVSNRAWITLLGASGVGASVFGFLVV